MLTRFYHKCFEDSHISQFIRNNGDPHAERLANWIIEKMGGEGKPWTKERVERSKCPVHATLGDGREHIVHDRTSAHVAAWFSPKRSPEDMGERFKVHDARVWMRLMFWSARETEVFHTSPSFKYWYPQFIAHFMRVYEHAAPQYAQDSLQWSENEENTEMYISGGRHMGDVLDSRHQSRGRVW